MDNFNWNGALSNSADTKPRANDVTICQHRGEDETQLSIRVSGSDMTDTGDGSVNGSDMTSTVDGSVVTRERRGTISKVKARLSDIYTNVAKRSASLKSEIFGKGAFQFGLMENNDIPTKPTTKCSSLKRVLVGLSAGLLFGGLLFPAAHFIHHYTKIEAAWISGAVTLVMSIGMIVSPHVRCLAALMSVSVFTNQGRVALLSLIPGLLLAGPLMNIRINIDQGANSVACMAETVYNESRQLHRMLTLELERQQDQLEDSAAILSQGLANLTSRDNPFIPGGNETSCRERAESTRRQCEVNSDVLKDNCTSLTRSTPPVFKRKLSSFFGECEMVCSLISADTLCKHLDPDEVCTSRKRRDLSPGRERLKQSIKEELGFQVNGSRVVDLRANTSFNPVNRIKGITDDVQSFMDQVTNIVGIVNKILIIFIFLAFVNAGLYQWRYLCSLKYDNIYVTSEFRRLDRNERAVSKEKAVLPLRKKEMKKYIMSTSIKPCDAERLAWKVGVARLLLHILFGTIFILLDYGLFSLLVLVKDNIDVDLFFSGGAFLEVDIEGSGPVAQFVKDLYSRNTTGSVENVLNFEHCAPNPFLPSRKYVYLIATLYILVLFLVLVQGYGLRLRRKIMAFFFPKQETERIEYLYRHVMIKRRLAELEGKPTSHNRIQ